MNITCPSNSCPILLSSSCVFYQGPNLVCTGITNNDTLESALKKINDIICISSGSGVNLQQVVNVGNTIVMSTNVPKGIDITLTNLATTYQIGTKVTIPSQTGIYPTFQPAPDAFVAILNGQNPANLVGFVGGFVSEATGADNIGFFAGSNTGAQDSVGFFSRSTDAHTGPHFIATKIVSGNSTSVFRVDNNGDTTAKSFIKTGGTSSQFLKANGTVDSNTYALDSTVVHKAGNETITGSKTFDYGTTIGVSAPVIINMPAQTQTALSPDALLIKINGQTPQSTPGFIGGVAVTADGLDNIPFFATLKTTASSPYASFYARSEDANTTDYFQGVKNIISTGQITTVFRVEHTGDVTATKFVKTGGNSSEFLMADGSVSTGPSLANYVPYTGATTNVNLGIHNLTATSLIKNGGTSGQFLKADGSIDSSAYIVLGSLSASSPLTYNNTTGAFNISQSGAVGAGYLSSIDWNTFNNKQEALTLTTTGTGAATFVANVLNIPTPPVSTGVTSVTGTSPIISSGGTAPAISIPLGTSLVDGYLSAIDRTNFETAYINRITSLTTTGTGAATLANSVLNIPTPSAIGGSGTINKIAKFTAAGAVGNSSLFDDANQVLIGTTLTGNVYNFESSKLVVANNIQSGTFPSTIEIRNLQTNIAAGNSMGKLTFSSASGIPSGGSAPVALSYGAIEALAAGPQVSGSTSGGILRFLAGGAGNTGQTIDEKMRIDESGNALIGTTDGSASLGGYTAKLVASSGAPTSIAIRNTGVLIAGAKIGGLVFQGAGSQVGAPLFSWASIDAVCANGPLGDDPRGGELRFSTVGSGSFATPSTAMIIDRKGSVGISSTSINQSAVLEVSSTTKGFLPPRMTGAQKNVIGSPTPGLIVYDTTSNKLCCWNGTIWNDLF